MKITKRDFVRILPEHQEDGDKEYVWVAASNEAENGDLKIKAFDFDGEKVMRVRTLKASMVKPWLEPSIEKIL